MNKTLKVLLLVVIVVSCFVSGLSIGVIIESMERIRTKVDETQKYLRSAEFMVQAGSGTLSDDEKSEIFVPFWETFDLLHEYYVDRPLDETALMEGAIRGMIESLNDQHTRYSDPKSYLQEVESIQGNYQGIGATVDVSGDYVKIIELSHGSPAEKAKLQKDDLVIAVDGVDATGMDPNEVVQMMRGPEGSQVTLTIQRGEEKPFNVNIVRGKIEILQAEGKMLDDGIAYLQLTQFGETMIAEMRDALEQLMKQKPRGLILDLRDNGGGFLDAAVECAAEFLPEGSLVLTDLDYSGKSTEYRTDKGIGRALDIPMVVLVNEYTASASEIVTGALKYYERATVIGVTSYGKGSEQIQTVLSNNGAVSITVGRWYTPDGALIHGIGIEPDIVVEMTEEDYENEVDPQLDAAVSFLKGDLAENQNEDDNKAEGF